MILEWVDADKLSKNVPKWDDIDLYAPVEVVDPLLDNGLKPWGAHVRR